MYVHEQVYAHMPQHACGVPGHLAGMFFFPFYYLSSGSHTRVVGLAARAVVSLAVSSTLCLSVSASGKAWPSSPPELLNKFFGLLCVCHGHPDASSFG